MRTCDHPQKPQACPRHRRKYGGFVIPYVNRKVPSLRRLPRPVLGTQASSLAALQGTVVVDIVIDPIAQHQRHEHSYGAATRRWRDVRSMPQSARSRPDGVNAPTRVP